MISFMRLYVIIVLRFSLKMVGYLRRILRSIRITRDILTV